MIFMASLNPALKPFWKTKGIRNRVLYGGRASSKCLAIGTNVIMADYTLKAVEDVVAGDRLLSPDGSIRNVLSTTRGHAELYRIKQHFGKDYVVNGDHLLSLKKRTGTANEKGELMPSGNYRRPNGRYPSEPEIINISVDDYLKKSTKWRDNFRGYKSGLIEFNQYQPLPIDPYFIGLWLGDGCYREPQITSMDTEVIDYCQRLADNLSLKLTVYKKKLQQAYSLSFCKTSGNINPLWAEMAKLGICQHRDRKVKAESKKHIPLQYLTASETDRLELLAGLLDSDGTYCKNKNCFVFSQVKKQLFDGVVRLSNGLGFRTTSSKKNTKCGEKISHTYSVTIAGKLSRIPTKIERKKATDGVNTSDLLTNSLKVEPIGFGEYAGFTLDGDHLFMLEDHTVTHNSWDAAGVAIARAAYCKTRFLCTRQFQNKIEESVYTLLKIQIERFGLSDQFKILDNKIICTTTGSEFVFYGLWRHVGEIKSLEGIDVHWAEEAHLLSKEQWEIIEPTIRKEGSENWLIFNPRLVTDFVWKRFVVNPPPNTLVRKINYDENPFLSKTMLDIIEGVKAESTEDYDHIYLGEPKSDDNAAIIKRAWLIASIDAHIKLGIEPRGAKIIGFDVADGSDNPNDSHDECAIVEAHGPLFTWCDAWRAKEDEILESSGRAWNTAKDRGDTLINYDSIGVGASCGNYFKKLNAQNNGIYQIAYQKFPAGGSPLKPDKFYKDTKTKNKDHFSNLKAQTWFTVAERFMNTYNAVTKGHQYNDAEMLFLSSDMPNLERLIDELSTPKKAYDANNRVMVESKKDLIKRGIKSPNLADAAIMASSPIRPMSINPNALR